jgi:hypothetical protein
MVHTKRFSRVDGPTFGLWFIGMFSTQALGFIVKFSAQAAFQHDAFGFS